MKRKILALATALALALSLSVCVSAAGQQAGSWTKLSDGYTADTPGTQPTAVPLILTRSQTGSMQTTPCVPSPWGTRRMLSSWSAGTAAK